MKTIQEIRERARSFSADRRRRLAWDLFARGSRIGARGRSRFVAGEKAWRKAWRAQGCRVKMYAQIRYVIGRPDYETEGGPHGPLPEGLVEVASGGGYGAGSAVPWRAFAPAEGV